MLAPAVLEHPDTELREPSHSSEHQVSGSATVLGTHTTTIETGSLDKALRALNLSRMLATIDARLARARGGELGHIEFRQVLCEDEISRRETMSMTRRLRKARFEEQATLEGFDFTASPKLPAAQIRDLAALRWLHAGESVILYGPVSVGKSHVAQALGHLAIRHGADVRFLKTGRALAHLAGGLANHTWHKRLGEFARPAVLIVDDFAMRELTPARPKTSTNSSPNGPAVPGADLEQGATGLVPALRQPRRRPAGRSALRTRPAVMVW